MTDNGDPKINARQRPLLPGLGQPRHFSGQLAKDAKSPVSVYVRLRKPTQYKLQ